MCGICGQVLFDREARVDPEELRRMTEAITHRGPDSDGCYLADTVGLGMRRLCVPQLHVLLQ